MKYSHFKHPPMWRVGRPVILLLTVVVCILTATACHAADAYQPATVEKAQTLSQLVSGIVTRSSDLTYITDQDSEVFVFYRNTRVEELTDEVLLSLLKRPPGSKIRQEAWAAFFQPRVNNDPTGRWAILRQHLESNLTNLTVFRVPRDPPYDAQYDLYAVGIFNRNTVVGVQMFGVAT